MEVEDFYKDVVDKENFHSYIVMSDSVPMETNYDTLELEKEETIYIPKGVEYKINGDLDLLKSYVER